MSNQMIKKRYMFAIPGNVGYEFIEAFSLEEAEKIADSMCQAHSFFDGSVRPLVTEVNQNTIKTIQ